MKNFGSRLIAIALMCAMLMGVLPILSVGTRAAQNGSCGENITWTLEEGVLTLSGTGATTEFTRVAATDTVNYPWADDIDRITTIVVGEGITNLDNYCFYNLSNVTSVTLPESLKRVETRVFTGCTELKELTINSTLDWAGYEAFAGSGITDLYFTADPPKGCSGTAPCKNLTYNLHYACNNTAWTADKVAALGGTPTQIPEHDLVDGICNLCNSQPVEQVGGSCGETALWTLAGEVLTITGTGSTDEYVRTAATDTVNYPWADYIDQITTILVEEGITTLDNYCFYNLSKVTSVTLPASLERLETRIFSGCTALEELTVNSGLKYLGFEALAASGITDLYFTAGAPEKFSGTAPCKSLVYNLHVPCNDTTWTAEKVASLGGTSTQVIDHNYENGICAGCADQQEGQITGTCGDNITWKLEEGVLTLSGTGETAEYTRDSATDTVNYPWANFTNAITAIVVEEGITNLDNYLFYNLKNVTAVTLPKSLERLETRIFKGCTALQELTVPSSLKYLGLEALAPSGITSLYFTAGAPEKFSGTKPCGNQSINLHIPCNDATWTADKLAAMGSAVTLVQEHSWEGTVCNACGASQDTLVTELTLDKTEWTMSLMETVTLVASVKPDNATDKTVLWSSGDESVAVVSGGTVTPKKAGTVTITATAADGSGCEAFCVITVTDELEGSCGVDARWAIKDGVLTISGTGSTTEYKRDSATDTVNTPWYNGREMITAIVVEEGITVLDNYVFYGLSNVASVTLPKTLTRIETRVFTKCSSLTQLTVPASKVYLGFEAFAGSGITDLYFTAGAHGGCSTTAPCNNMIYQLHLPCTAQNWTAAQMDAMGGNMTLVIDHSWQEGRCTACGAKEDTPVTGITLNKTEISIYCMGTQILKATVTPADATNTVLEWTSSDDAIATVSSVGTVTGVAPGTAVITAAAKDGSGISATCTVTVMEGLGGSCGDYASWTFKDGVLTISGWGSTTKFVRNTQKDTINYPWASFKDEITRVVVGEGITVLNNYAFYNCSNIRSVRLPSTLKEIAYGAFQGTSRLGAVTIPANVNKLGSQAFKGSGLKTITFTGLTPSSFGKNLFDGVKAKVYYLCNDSERSYGKGLTWEKTHTFEEKDGVRRCSKCHELDGTPVTSVTLDQTEILLMIGDSLKLNATVEPADAAYPGVIWSSSEEAVVMVSEDGTLTAVEAGSAQIVAKAKDGGDVQAICNVTVRQGVGGQVGDLFWIYHYGKLTVTGQGPMPQISIAPWAMYADEIVELTLESGVTTVGDKAFAGLEQLAIVNLPDTLTQIGAGAFENTQLLTEIKIPASVTELGSRAFAVSGLKEIAFSGYLPEAAADVFEGVTATATILCDDTPKDMGGTITWQQGHDYQPTGDKLVCINCGHATEEPRNTSKSENSMSWLWWVLGVLAAAAVGTAVILTRKKKEK